MRTAGRAIQREVLADALRHPATLYPLAAASVAGIYALFLSSFFGGMVPALPIALGAASVGLASFAWHYLVQGERYAREKAETRIAEEVVQRRLETHVALARQRRRLEDGFTALRSGDGLKALNQLTAEWRHLQEALARSADDGLFLSDDIARSAHDTYAQGLEALAKALELMQAVDTVDQPALAAKVAELEADLARTPRGNAGAASGRTRQAVLASHQQRLTLLREQNAQMETLLHEVALAEGALQHARVVLPTINAVDQAGDEALGVGETLAQTVDRAQRVHQRLRGDALADADERRVQDRDERVR